MGASDPIGAPPLKAYGRFQCVKRIGAGGMGVVYEGIDLDRGESVAIKALANRDPETIAALKREFRALQDLHHPNLVALHELVADEDGVYIAMELVPGTDLMTYIRGEPEAQPPAVARDLATAIVRRHADNERDEGAPREGPGASRAAAGLKERARIAFDEDRLRSVFRQVALGLSALHRVGKVHRDVKPSNVRVTPEGRAVLLDFGLIVDVTSAAEHDDGSIVGTPGYMAPEQVTGEPVGPAADLYAVGVMLYEALTGSQPFEGSAEAILMAKTYNEPLPASSLVADVPEDLNALASGLLRLEPGERVVMEELLESLRTRSVEPGSGAGLADRSGDSVFVGRGRELMMLEAAFDDVRGGRATVACVRGESGVGKSALVRHYRQSLMSRYPETVVLSGRCYEREAVPYKALDEVVDGLSRLLLGFDRETLNGLLPSGVEALMALFPSLGRVPSIRRTTSAFERDPHERRRAAFHSLRELFRKLGDRFDLVVNIDDLHWTDADSLSLLTYVLSPPDAPRLLLLVTQRPTMDGGTDLLAGLPAVHRIDVGRLDAGEAGRLVSGLVGHASLSTTEVDAIIREADGHPLFIDELVRHAGIQGRRGAEPLRLDDALFRRVESLPEPEKKSLFAVCLLGVPIAQDVIARAVGVSRAELGRQVMHLRAAQFVRTRGPRMSDAIEPFHDRVREAVVARMAAAEKKEIHAWIAEALEIDLSRAVDPELLAEQWHAAGNDERAAHHTLVAAERSVRALAFNRAARLYEHGLALLPQTDPKRRVVREQLGEALANAGNSAGAAAAFEQAALESNARDAIDLRRRAADQLVRAGRIGEGLELARTVLAAVDLGIPRGVLALILFFVWYRWRLRVRGFAPNLLRPNEEIPADVLTQLDASWSVSMTVPFADPLAAGVSLARHVRLALDVGEPARAARALALEAAYEAATTSGSVPATLALIARARALAVAADDIYAQAVVFANEGIVHFANFKFETAIPLLEQAIALLRETCPGSAFEVSINQYFLFLCMSHSGRYAALRPRAEAALDAARERGDLFASCVLGLGATNTAWLVTGKPERAKREIDEAAARWPNDRFHTVHYQLLIAEGYVLVFDGDYERAYRKVHAALPALRRSLLLEMEGFRLELAALRVRLAIGYASQLPKERRGKLIREARRMQAIIAKRDWANRRLYVNLFRSNLAMLRGERTDALAALRAIAADEVTDLWLGRECARIVAGQMIGDRDLEALGRANIERQGCVVSEGVVRLFFPVPASGR